MRIKKIIAVTAVALAAVVVAPVPAHADPPMRLFVERGGADVGDCAASPCASLAYALTRVPTRTPDGVDISVGRGSFPANLVISTGQVVTIHGDGFADTVLDGAWSGPVITNFGKLTLQDLTVSGGSNGGVLNFYDSLQLVRSQIAGNASTVLGGGVYSYFGDVSVIDSRIAFNQAPSGAGIFLYAATATVTGSVIARNQTPPDNGFGGGIYAQSGTLHIRDSTLSGNIAAGQGGGLMAGGSGKVSLTHVTVTGNQAGQYAGVAVKADAEVKLLASLLSGNVGANCAAALPGKITTTSTVDSDASCPPGPGTIRGTDAELGPLLDNGGPTPTHSYAPSSVAHNAIPVDSPWCDGTDQRGLPRRYGNSTGCDAGAIQLPTPAMIVAGNKDTDFGIVTEGKTAVQTVTLTNTGGTPLIITAVSVAGAGYRIVSENCTNQTLTPAQLCKLKIEFSPIAQPYGGTLTIADNTTATPTAIALTGNGAGAPVPHTPPTITGTAVNDTTLTTTTGQWGGAAPTTYTYQWLRCDPADKCVKIPKATAASYTVTKLDAGYRLAVSVTAHNATGDSDPVTAYAD